MRQSAPCVRASTIGVKGCTRGDRVNAEMGESRTKATPSDGQALMTQVTHTPRFVTCCPMRRRASCVEASRFMGETPSVRGPTLTALRVVAAERALVQ